ncbi:hypothetical protein LJC09_02520 [Desulfovibrio sp. OttesenSCG-928-F20]|nr:hypothetical protein [Desulfovibrio sp. OttesenSCG-928-F20]
MNAFPYGFKYAPYPERPAYVLSLIGMTSYFLSLNWLGQLRRHRTMLLLVGAFLFCGLGATLAGGLRLGGGDLLEFSLLNYLYRKVFPCLYVLWFAFLLSTLEEGARRRFFIGALLVLFIPNAAHMILENLGNFGLTAAKEFLIDINPWLRTENTSHGSWPPVYYTDRVRGLFAEPSHLAYAFIPLLGFFFHKIHEKLIYLLPLLLLAFSYFFKIPTLTGIVSLGIFFIAYVLRLFMPVMSRRPGRAAVCLLALSACALVYFSTLPLGTHLGKEWQQAGHIAAYCKQAQDDPSVAPPQLHIKNESRIFTRMTALRLETDIALEHPLGVGFYLSGFYWQPLRIWETQPQEIFRYVLYAFKKPVPVIPQLCEYSALACELGFPSLILFLALCLYIGGLACKRHAQDRDTFLFYMIVSLVAFMAALFSFALKSGFMLYYFLGFLYAISQAANEHREAGW